MRKLYWLHTFVVLVVLFSVSNAFAVEPSESSGWPNLAEVRSNRAERMEWWRDARFGMFIHFGLYSVPAGEWNGQQYGGYSEWLPQGIPTAQWEKLTDRFNPTDFDADEWVLLAKQAGMKYIVITTKHHEGFALWDSKASDYDVQATPFKRDIMKELAEACRRHDMKLGWYHSVLDWHHPDYLPRRAVDKRSTDDADYDRYISYMKAQLRELLTNYGDIAVLWFDGGWDHGPRQHRAWEICDMAYELQPDIIINDRIGLPMDYDTPEQRIPRGASDRPWETCMTITSSWGYNKGARDWKDAKALIRNLVDIASKGGNYLLNVGPTGEGVIPPQSADRLREIGEWLEINGRSIYGTKGSIFRSTDSTRWGRCTTRMTGDGTTLVYLHVFDWPSGSSLSIPELGNLPDEAYLLADRDAKLTARKAGKGISIDLAEVESAVNSVDTVVVLEYAEQKPVTFHPPRIESVSEMFIDDLTLKLSSEPGLQIRYTLDGSDVTSQSKLYVEPFAISTSITVKAASFYGDHLVCEQVEKEFEKVKPAEAVKLEQARPGLEYKYYEYDGEVKTLSDIDRDNTTGFGVTTQVDLERRKRQEEFAMIFEGYISVPATDVYDFELISDDGSRLTVAGREVVDNDGLHSREAKHGSIALEKGLQRVRVEYFNGLGGAELELRSGSAGKKADKVSGDRLFH
ncbi:Alpha-L-fucosidase [Anaerohalosphaera lusitana]|uniref:alpha-L-fucosidase n=1 Tax=Anaerohalosphaera lusitana TaxID=1936003 RepID=A0A1U9NMN6_9BACT|nr:alpha-L-fucosidase [Anaerohalosphaera lusitana]AQT68860.1 Alpha-L-fucosidase [Anaerohalosphaera lusitana]